MNVDKGRRKFVIGSSTAGIALLISGCLSDDSDDGDDPDLEEVELEVTVNFDYPVDSEEYQQLVRESGVPDHVTLNWAGQPPWDEAKSRFETVFETQQEEPEVLSLAYEWIIEWKHREYLADLREHLSEDALARIDNHFFESFVESSTHEGALYGVPFFPDFSMVCYRKDLLVDAGYGEEAKEWLTSPPTYEEFTAIVHETMNETDVEYGHLFPGDGQQFSQIDWLAPVHAFGGSLYGGLEYELEFDSVGDRPVTIDEEPAHRATDMIHSWIHGSMDEFPQISPEAVLGWDLGEIIEQFNAGNAVSARGWPVFASIFYGEFGDDLGVMGGMPVGVSPEEALYDGLGGPATALGGWQWGLNQFSPHIEEMAAVVEALISEESQKHIFETQGLVPADTRIFESEELLETDIGQYLPALENAGNNAISYPVSPVLGELNARIQDQIGSVLRNSKSTNEALADLQSDVEAIEATYSS